MSRHATSGPSDDPDPAPEPSHAERARTLLQAGSVGVLSTHSEKRPGFPFGSTMPYALDAAGRPLFLISSMAMHTQNLLKDGRASLFVTVPEAQADPLGAARLTVVGKAEPVGASDPAGAREAYLARHPNARAYVDFGDFSFWRLAPVDLYFVGGFGVMGWVEAAAYAKAEPDPLAAAAAGILAHMNADHADALLAIAAREKGLTGAEPKMTAVDRLGFNLRLRTPERMRSVRIAFPAEVRSPAACRDALIAMAKEARGG